jgi:hypothetical protein
MIFVPNANLSPVATAVFQYYTYATFDVFPSNNVKREIIITYLLHGAESFLRS